MLRREELPEVRVRDRKQYTAFAGPKLPGIPRGRPNLGAFIILDDSIRSADARPLRRAAVYAGEEEQARSRSSSVNTIRRHTTGGQVHAGVYGRHRISGGCASITTTA